MAVVFHKTRVLVTSPVAAPLCVKDGSVVLSTGNQDRTITVKQRRVKPKPVWKFPTNLGPYVTYAYDYPVGRTITAFTCGGNKRSYTSASAVQITTPISAEATQPWQNVLNAKVKDLRVNLAGDMAEFGQTVDLATTVAKELFQFGKGLAKAVRFAKSPGRGLSEYLRRYGVSSAHRMGGSWQNIPAAYLASTYGLEPLLGSLYDSFTALNNPARERPIYRVISFRTQVESHGPAVDQWGRNARGVTSCLTQQRTKAIVELRPNRGLWKDNFTPGNPLEWLWESIPFSFMVDWFIPIGKTLSSLDAYEGVAGIWGTNTLRVLAYAHSVEPSYSGFNGGVNPKGNIIYKKYQRTAFTSSVGSILPTYSPSSGVRKLVNASTILTQLRMGR